MSEAAVINLQAVKCFVYNKSKHINSYSFFLYKIDYLILFNCHALIQPLVSQYYDVIRRRMTELFLLRTLNTFAVISNWLNFCITVLFHVTDLYITLLLIETFKCVILAFVLSFFSFILDRVDFPEG